MTPTEAGIPRLAPSAADLAATVRRALIHTPDANPALDALLARCEEAEQRWYELADISLVARDVRARAESAEERVAELEAALKRISESRQATSAGKVAAEDLRWEPLPGAACAEIARAALASPPETTT